MTAPDTPDDGASDRWARLAARVDAGPGWLRDTNAAMDLPADQGRARLDALAAQRRSRAAELRARAESGDGRWRDAFGQAAARVEDSAGLLEAARDRLDDLAAAGEVATGREQIDRETNQQPGRGWSM